MIEGIDACIIAGGKSRRFGQDKSLYVFNGKPMIGHVLDTVRQLFHRVAIISSDTGKFAFTGVPVYPDIIPDLGPLGGIHTALEHSAGRPVFVVACDMPFLSAHLIEFMCGRLSAESSDLLIPLIGGNYEPLHAIYGRGCLEPIKNLIARNDRKILNFFPAVNLQTVSDEERRRFDPDETVFINLNYLEDVEKLSQPLRAE